MSVTVVPYETEFFLQMEFEVIVLIRVFYIHCV